MALFRASRQLHRITVSLDCLSFAIGYRVIILVLVLQRSESLVFIIPEGIVTMSSKILREVDNQIRICSHLCNFFSF